MIIVPHLRWRTFRYWAIRASDARHRFESRWGHWVIPLLTLTLKFHDYLQRSPSKPASTLLPVASSLHHPCSNNVLRLFLYYVQHKEKHNKSKRVACRHQTFNISSQMITLAPVDNISSQMITFRPR